MSNEQLAAFEQAVVGRSCTVTRRDHDWWFAFERDDGIAVSTPWRFVSRGVIALTDSDDKQWFGLSAPIDAEVRANSLLNGRKVVGVKVDAATADLCVWFSDDLKLDLFNNSSGYEGWEAKFTHNENVINIIALGGGGFA